MTLPSPFACVCHGDTVGERTGWQRGFALALFLLSFARFGALCLGFLDACYVVCAGKMGKGRSSDSWTSELVQMPDTRTMYPTVRRPICASMRKGVL